MVQNYVQIWRFQNIFRCNLIEQLHLVYDLINFCIYVFQCLSYSLYFLNYAVKSLSPAKFYLTFR